jgi:hypothetical protein
MIGIPVGLLYTNASEWLIHKYWLHGRGKKKESFWNFHWGEHHGVSRKHDMIDDAYVNGLFKKWDPQTKEAVMLMLGVAVHAPLAPVAPFFVGTVAWSAMNYYRVHKKAHLDSEWARENLPHHYDHHMGPNQDANWCVTHPFFDWVMNTREPYLGTDKEKADTERRLRRQRRSGDAEGTGPQRAAA